MKVLWNARLLLWQLTMRELRQRYMGSAGGWLWIIVKPAFTVLAYLFVFDLVFKVRLDSGEGTRFFGIYLLTGLIPWLALNEGVIDGTNSLIGAGHLLKKTALPLELFPARSVLSSGLLYLPIIIILAIAMMVSRKSPDWGLLVFLWFALQLMLTYHLSLVLSLLAAALRDTIQVVSMITSIWVFLAPVLYPMERVPESLQVVLWLNPGTPLVLGYHSLILKGTLPAETVMMSALLWIILFSGIGWILLRRCREQVVDWL